MVRIIVLFLITFFLLLIPVTATDYFRQLQDFSATGINAASTGSTLIGTTQNGTQAFHPLFVVFKMTAANTITIVPIVSVGTNASTYNNVIALTTLTGLTSVGAMLPTNITTVIGAIPANTAIFANIGTGATATTATLEVHLFGYYN